MKTLKYLFFCFFLFNSFVIPVQASETITNEIIEKNYDSLPVSYDLRDYGRVTSVKNQGLTPTCNSFAAIGAIESNLITQGYTDKNIDLSESQLTWFYKYLGYSYYEPYIKGTEQLGIIKNLSNGFGLELEEYSPDVITNKPTYDERQGKVSYYQLQNAYLYPNDINIIKQNIIKRGACCVSFKNNLDYYQINPTGEMTFYYSNNKGSSHSVLIIGWDDNFSASKFKDTPDIDGAWLCKNSWGSSWGEEGYFWISYKEPTLHKFYSMEVGLHQYKNNIYKCFNQYEGFCFRESSKYFATKAANVFSVSAGESIESVSFYTGYNNYETNKINLTDFSYTLKIYSDSKNNNPESGTLIFSKNDVLKYTIFHTVKLNNPIIIPEDKNISIVLELTNLNTKMKGVCSAHYSNVKCNTYYFYKGKWKKQDEVVDSLVLHNAAISMKTCTNSYDVKLMQKKLQTLVNETEQVDFSLYTEKSKKTILLALDEAKHVLDKDLSSKYVENALIHLSIAVDQSEKVRTDILQDEKIEENTSLNISKYDMNNDGKITSIDALLILKKVNGTESGEYVCTDVLRALQYSTKVK